VFIHIHDDVTLIIGRVHRVAALPLKVSFSLSLSLSLSFYLSLCVSLYHSAVGLCQGYREYRGPRLCRDAGWLDLDGRSSTDTRL